MNFFTAKPSISLSHLVRQYWEIDADSQESMHKQRIIPTGLTEIFFYFSSQPNSIDGKRSFCGSSFISGLQNDFYDIGMKGSYSIFAVQMQPFSAKMLTAIPSSEFANQMVPLSDAIGCDSKQIEEIMEYCSTFEERVAKFEEYLFKIIQKQKKDFQAPRIMDAVLQISKAKGNISLDELISRACLGKRQFDRNFLEYVGLTPKQFMRNVRFQYSLYKKSHSPESSITEIAYESGYYDQAHMINEYKKLAGITPKEFYQECDPYSDYFE